MSKRIKKIFETKGKKLVTFTTGGDPDLNTSLEILKTIINNGIDIIEIGMPFSDPIADGPTIQESSVRSLENGTKINDIFEIVLNVRKLNKKIPIILMGYYNSIFNLGIENFTSKCAETGVDGLIIVDLQPEEDSELYSKTKEKNIDLTSLKEGIGMGDPAEGDEEEPFMGEMTEEEFESVRSSLKSAKSQED